jgi:hypothetical protein
MNQMMKVEWNNDIGQYQSRLLPEDLAWQLYYDLEQEGIEAGIESMSRWECEQYLKEQTFE